ncbi:ABC transporter permease [Aneurinibacillus aneurinilyticus]|uniref:FtsX-like permease family protein n=2 Tax=Aneurinibacillus aneurinilyticus TaxID=1391 RepID=A0A848CPU5_ANEAE|nr:FtsX-like permease family protein [Aneurinibacillus aneurinilyticus]NME97031.1 FtsX-like permease family protein [Aneurinibacillus aneurinilyticus]
MTFRQIARSNIKGNLYRYLTYYASTVCIVMIFFMYAAFIFHPDVATAHFRPSVRRGMILAEYIIIIFSFFFMLYSSSAFLTARKKEFGLLNLLGMSQPQLNRLLMYESIIISVLSIGTGIGLGLLFTKLFFMVLDVLLEMPEPLAFIIAPEALGLTFLSFFILSQLLFLVPLWRVGRTPIIELLRVARQPKQMPVYSKWLILFSLFCLGAGYGMAWWGGKDYLFILMLPILVATIIGTYFLFTQGSIAILYRLRHNRRLFYNRTNLLIVSQLIFKLKDNARVLFSVAILSAVVLTASGTFYTMFAGMKQWAELNVPDTFSFLAKNEGDAARFEQAVSSAASKEGIGVNTPERITMLTVKVATKVSADAPPFRQPEEAHVLSVRDFNHRAERLGTPTIQLESGEMLLLTPYRQLTDPVYPVGTAITFRSGAISETARLKEQRAGTNLNLFTYTVVLPDSDFAALHAQVPPSSRHVYSALHTEKWEKTKQLMTLVRSELPPSWQKDIATRIEPYLEERDSYALTLFLGVFVAILFFIAAGSMIYFRLFTELQEDRAQNMALSRIGMTEEELKRIATVQIGIIFFLPFLIGSIHAAFALKTLGDILAISVWNYGLLVIVVYFAMQFIYFLLSRHMYFRQIHRAGY